MDSVGSWLVLLLLANAGFILAVRECKIEKEQYRSENEAFFRRHDRK